MANDQQAGLPGAADARVAGAAAHWGYRFTVERHRLRATSPRPWPGSPGGRTGAGSGASPRRTTSSSPSPPRTRGSARPPPAPGSAPPWPGTGASSCSSTTRYSSAPRTSGPSPASSGPRPPSPRRPSWCASPTAAPPWPPTSASARGRPRRPAGRDHGPRPRLHQGGAAVHRRVLPRPRARHPGHRRPRPGRGRVRAAHRARLREGGHRGGGLPAGPRGPRPRTGSACSA